MKGGWKLSDESRKNISEAKKRTWKNPIYRQRMELLYANPERKKRVSEIAKEVLSRPEVKLKLSDIGKKKCEDPLERERLIKILRDPNTVQRKREANAKQSFRENASKKQKEVWKNPDYRESQLKAMREKHKDPIYRERASNAAKKRFEDPNEHIKTSIGIKRAYSNMEIREKIKQSIREKHSDPEYHKKLCESRADPNYRKMQRDIQALPEIKMRHIEGQIGGFWYGNVRYYDDVSYCEKFNKEFKERVRAFRGYVCFECGTPQNGKSLPIHHVHYDKKMCCNGSPQDVVPLCPSCHAIANFNRDYWEEHFTRLLYAYNPDGKCFLTKGEMVAYTGAYGLGVT